MRLQPVVVGLALVGAPVAFAAAQAGGRTIDEGSFAVTRHGAPIGREFFRIVRGPSGSGDLYRATAQLLYGERRVVPALSADTTGAPVSYDVAVRDGNAAVVRVQARSRPGRFSAMLVTPTGESSKEYMVPHNTVVLDDEIAHQYFFVALGRKSGSVTLLDPRSDVQATGTLERQGAETIQVGGQPLSASHYVLRTPGAPRREFWVDAEGRVLRVAVPERGLLAQREDPPR